MGGKPEQSPRARRLAGFVALTAAAVLVLTSCNAGTSNESAAPSTSGGSSPSTSPATSPTTGETTAPANDAPATPATKAIPLRAGEHLVDLTMPAAYTPKAPTYGTDDYRCFLLDPHLAKSAFVTGVNVLPGQPKVVHHVILFQVPPGQVKAAERQDASEPGEGWTCFGGPGIGNVGAGLDAAPWIGAWAPGGGERVMEPGIGIPLAAGSRVIMQVHYNLLAGDEPDKSAAELRMVPGSRHLDPLDTVLLVAPVELPCRPGHDSNPLCDRAKALADVTGRFGTQAGFTVGGLQLLCGGSLQDPVAGSTQHCDRTVQSGGTIRAVAGHMHLLGRRIKIEVNPGTPRARTILDVHPWNFDEQGSVPVKPAVHVNAGDTLRVTCTHSQHMRDLLPDLANIPERYVVWGEGTTDEMCLGIVLMTKD